MSTVPYIFASQSGNIQLSELDANFSNVKASVDYAVTAGLATTATLATVATTSTVAGTVTASAQPNITSVGSNLTVSGNISSGNILNSGIISSTGNVICGNVNATVLFAFGNISGANLRATGDLQILANIAVPAGGANGSGLKMSSTENLGVFFGSGIPTLSAAQGSLYLRTDGSSTSTRMYVNTDGSTGWTNVVTAT